MALSAYIDKNATRVLKQEDIVGKSYLTPPIYSNSTQGSMSSTTLQSTPSTEFSKTDEELFTILPYGSQQTPTPKKQLQETSHEFTNRTVAASPEAGNATFIHQ